MNTLLLNASPRKKNTAELLNRISEMLIQAGHIVQMTHLSDFTIKECIGCHKCLYDGEQFCPLQDDVQKLWNMFLTADGIVIGSPVYLLGIPGSLKNFMDRLAYNAHRPRMYNKPAVFITDTAGMGTQSAIRQLRWFEIAGMRMVGSKGFAVYPAGTDKPAVARKKQANLQKLAAKLDSAMKDTRIRKPTLMQTIQFYGLKMNSVFGKEVYKADFDSYLGKDYHFKVKVNPIKSAIGKLFYKIGMFAMQSAIDLKPEKRL